MDNFFHYFIHSDLFMAYPKIDIDFWVNRPRLILSGVTRRGSGQFLRRAIYHQYGEEQKLSDNKVWQPNRRFVK